MRQKGSNYRCCLPALAGFARPQSATPDGFVSMRRFLGNSTSPSGIFGHIPLASDPASEEFRLVFGFRLGSLQKSPISAHRDSRVRCLVGYLFGYQRLGLAARCFLMLLLGIHTLPSSLSLHLSSPAVLQCNPIVVSVLSLERNERQLLPNLKRKTCFLGGGRNQIHNMRAPRKSPRI